MRHKYKSLSIGKQKSDELIFGRVFDFREELRQNGRHGEINLAPFFFCVFGGAGRKRGEL